MIHSYDGMDGDITSQINTTNKSKLLHDDNFEYDPLRFSSTVRVPRFMNACLVTPLRGEMNMIWNRQCCAIGTVHRPLPCVGACCGVTQNFRIVGDVRESDNTTFFQVHYLSCTFRIYI